jgi:hypothetical protein
MKSLLFLRCTLKNIYYIILYCYNISVDLEFCLGSHNYEKLYYIINRVIYSMPTVSTQ